MKRSYKKIFTPIVVIFLLAFLVRIGFLIYHFKLSGKFQIRPYIPTADQRFYDSIAISFLKGYGLNWYNIHFSHYPPLYSIFLAFLYSFLGYSYHSYLAIFLVQAFLSSLAVVFVFLIGKRFFNSLTGLLAALMTIFYLPFIKANQDLVLENLLIFMPLLFIFYLLKIEEKDSLGNKIIAGVVMALTILTKGIFLLVLPLVVLLWFRLANARKNSWKTILIVCLAATPILSLWLTRNFLIHRKFLFSSQSGSALWIASHPKYGTYSRQGTREFFWEYSKLNEADRDSFYRKAGVNNLRKNPFLYLKRVIKNWQSLFYQNNSVDLPILLVLLASFGLILAVSKKNLHAVVLFIFFFLFCGQYSLFFTYPRFRMPLDWILIVFASYGFIELTKIIQKIIVPKSNLIAKIKQWELFINQNNISKKLSTKLKMTGGIICLVLICISLVKIVPRYLSKKIISYPNINSKSVEKVIENNNLSSQWQQQKNKQLEYKDVLSYQKNHQGNIEPFIGDLVIWRGEANYINHNAISPFGSAKHPTKSLDPEYQGFYDIYYRWSLINSIFDLTVNRGKKPQYYGDGVVMVNYKGSLLNKLKNGDKIAVIGKIIGQNYLGQIYLEGYEIYK